MKTLHLAVRWLMLVSMFIYSLGPEPLWANPAGGTVVAGSATISSSGNKETINQTSQRAIINWQSFSIAGNQLTYIAQPNSASAELDRVIGASPSNLLGALQSNGQVYLINPNGVVFGQGFQLNTAGFLASTLDTSNSSFMAGGNMYFSGNSTAGITNGGTLTATTGNVYLFARAVENDGTINATNGTVGLAGASDVLLSPSTDQHIYIQAGSQSGTVVNKGTVQSVAAELKAVGGNAGALAINNTGVVRATGVKNQGGHIWLTVTNGDISNSGSLVAQDSKGNGGTIQVEASSTAPTATPATLTNSGLIDASGTAGAGSVGGSVVVAGDNVHLTGSSEINVSGNAGGGTADIGGGSHGADASILDAQTTTVDAGSQVIANALLSGNGGNVVIWSNNNTQYFGNISAQALGSSGNGGQVEVSGGYLNFQGNVNTLSANGQAGTLLLDPATLTVTNGGVGTVVNGTNDTVSSTISPTTVDTALASANLLLTASNTLTVDSGITWTSANTLTLNTTTGGSTINLNAPITGASGGLIIDTAAATDNIYANSSVNVSTFNLESGTWNQVVGQNGLTALPTFNAPGNFTLSNGTTFLRAAGGLGTSGSPYQITDIYGLQGLASPSGQLQGTPVTPIDYIQTQNIDASVTAAWNSGSGFAPIGVSSPFYGTYNGEGYAISGLTINRPGQTYVGLFGSSGAGSELENIGLVGGSVQGYEYVGDLVGDNYGMVFSSYATGAVSGYNPIAGGLVGRNEFSGVVDFSYAAGNVSNLLAQSDAFGGLVGDSFGLIENSYATGNVSAYAGTDYVGGLVGNVFAGTVENCFATGTVTTAGSSAYVGGLEGFNGSDGSGTGTLQTSYATGAVNAGANSAFVGGLVGISLGTIATSYSTGPVTVGSGSTEFGGLVGYNTGTVTADYYAITNPGGGTINSGGSYNTIGTAETYAAMESSNTFTPQGTGAGQWDFTTPVWTTVGDTTTPLLEALTVTVSGTKPTAGDTVTLISSGAVYTAPNTGTGTNYSFVLPDNVLSTGLLVTDATGGNANTYYQIGLIPSSPITGVNLTNLVLAVQGTGIVSNSQIGNAVGGLTGDGLAFSVTSGSNVVTNAGVSMDVNLQAPFFINGALSTGTGNLTLDVTGGVTETAGASITGDNLILESAGAVTLTNTANTFSNLTISATNVTTAAATLSYAGTNGLAFSVTESTNGGITFSDNADFIGSGAGNSLTLIAGSGGIQFGTDVNGDGIINVPTLNLLSSGPVTTSGNLETVSGTTLNLRGTGGLGTSTNNRFVGQFSTLELPYGGGNVYYAEAGPIPALYLAGNAISVGSASNVIDIITGGQVAFTGPLSLAAGSDLVLRVVDASIAGQGNGSNDVEFGSTIDGTNGTGTLELLGGGGINVQDAGNGVNIAFNTDAGNVVINSFGGVNGTSIVSTANVPTVGNSAGSVRIYGHSPVFVNTSMSASAITVSNQDDQAGDINNIVVGSTGAVTLNATGSGGVTLQAGNSVIVTNGSTVEASGTAANAGDVLLQAQVQPAGSLQDGVGDILLNNGIISSAGGYVELEINNSYGSRTATISQTGGGITAATGLLIIGEPGNGAATTTTLTSGTNSVGTLAAVSSGPLSYTDSSTSGLTIGTVNGSNGITLNGTAASALNVTSTSGSVTVAQNVDTSLNGGEITLTGIGITENTNTTITAGAGQVVIYGTTGAVALNGTVTTTFTSPTPAGSNYTGYPDSSNALFIQGATISQGTNGVFNVANGVTRLVTTSTNAGNVSVTNNGNLNILDSNLSNASTTNEFVVGGNLTINLEGGALDQITATPPNGIAVAGTTTLVNVSSENLESDPANEFGGGIEDSQGNVLISHVGPVEIGNQSGEVSLTPFTLSGNLTVESLAEGYVFTSVLNTASAIALNGKNNAMTSLSVQTGAAPGSGYMNNQATSISQDTKANGGLITMLNPSTTYTTFLTENSASTSNTNTGAITLTDANALGITSFQAATVGTNTASAYQIANATVDIVDGVGDFLLGNSATTNTTSSALNDITLEASAGALVNSTATGSNSITVANGASLELVGKEIGDGSTNALTGVVQTNASSSTDSFTFQAIATTNAGGDILVQNNTGNVDLDAVNTAVSIPGDVRGLYAKSGKLDYYNAGGNITVDAPVAASHNLTVEALGSLTTDTGGTVVTGNTAGYTITLKSDTNSISIGDTVGATGPSAIDLISSTNSAGTINIGANVGIATTTNVTISNGGTLYNTGGTVTAKQIVLDGTGEIETTNAGPASAGLISATPDLVLNESGSTGPLWISNTATTLAVGGAVDSNLYLQSTGNIQIGETTTYPGGITVNGPDVVAIQAGTGNIEGITYQTNNTASITATTNGASLDLQAASGEVGALNPGYVKDQGNASLYALNIGGFNTLSGVSNTGFYVTDASAGQALNIGTVSSPLGQTNFGVSTSGITVGGANDGVIVNTEDALTVASGQGGVSTQNGYIQLVTTSTNASINVNELVSSGTANQATLYTDGAVNISSSNDISLGSTGADIYLASASLNSVYTTPLTINGNWTILGNVDIIVQAPIGTSTGNLTLVADRNDNGVGGILISNGNSYDGQVFADAGNITLAASDLYNGTKVGTAAMYDTTGNTTGIDYGSSQGNAIVFNTSAAGGAVQAPEGTVTLNVNRGQIGAIVQDGTNNNVNVTANQLIFNGTETNTNTFGGQGNVGIVSSTNPAINGTTNALVTDATFLSIYKVQPSGTNTANNVFLTSVSDITLDNAGVPNPVNSTVGNLDLEAIDGSSIMETSTLTANDLTLIAPTGSVTFGTANSVKNLDLGYAGAGSFTYNGVSALVVTGANAYQGTTTGVFASTSNTITIGTNQFTQDFGAPIVGQNVYLTFGPGTQGGLIDGSVSVTINNGGLFTQSNSGPPAPLIEGETLTLNDQNVIGNQDVGTSTNPILTKVEFLNFNREVGNNGNISNMYLSNSDNTGIEINASSIAQSYGNLTLAQTVPGNITEGGAINLDNVNGTATLNLSTVAGGINLAQAGGSAETGNVVDALGTITATNSPASGGYFLYDGSTGSTTHASGTNADTLQLNGPINASGNVSINMGTVNNIRGSTLGTINATGVSTSSGSITLGFYNGSFSAAIGNQYTSKNSSTGTPNTPPNSANYSTTNDAVAFYNSDNLSLNPGANVTARDSVTEYDLDGGLATVDLDANITTYGSAGPSPEPASITFQSAVYLTTNVTLNADFAHATFGNITFDQTLDDSTGNPDAYSLTALARNGNISFDGVVGGQTAPGNILAETNGTNIFGTSSNEITVRANSITTAGAVWTTNGPTVSNVTTGTTLIYASSITSDGYNSALDSGIIGGQVYGNHTLLEEPTTTLVGGNAGSASNNIIFLSTLNGTTTGSNNLFLTPGTGANLGSIAFVGDIGGTTRLGNITVTNAVNIDVNRTVTGTSNTFTGSGGLTAETFTQQAGSGTTTFGLGTVTETNSFPNEGAIDLSGSVAVGGTLPTSTNYPASDTPPTQDALYISSDNVTFSPGASVNTSFTTTSNSAGVIIINSGTLTMDQGADMGFNAYGGKIGNGYVSGTNTPGLNGQFLQLGTGPVVMGNNITTQGYAVFFNGAVTFNPVTAPVASTTTNPPTFINSSLINTTGNGKAAGGDIVFNGALNGATSDANNVTLNVGTGGNIYFYGPAGTTTPLGDLVIANAHNVTDNSNSIEARDFYQAGGTGTTTITGTVIADSNTFNESNTPIAMLTPTSAAASIVTPTNGGVVSNGGGIQITNQYIQISSNMTANGGGEIALTAQGAADGTNPTSPLTNPFAALLIENTTNGANGAVVTANGGGNINLSTTSTNGADVVISGGSQVLTTNGTGNITINSSDDVVLTGTNGVTEGLIQTSQGNISIVADNDLIDPNDNANGVLIQATTDTSGVAVIANGTLAITSTTTTSNQANGGELVILGGTATGAFANVSSTSNQTITVYGGLTTTNPATPEPNGDNTAVYVAGGTATGAYAELQTTTSNGYQTITADTGDVSVLGGRGGALAAGGNALIVSQGLNSGTNDAQTINVLGGNLNVISSTNSKSYIISSNTGLAEQYINASGTITVHGGTGILGSAAAIQGSGYNGTAGVAQDIIASSSATNAILVQGGAGITSTATISANGNFGTQVVDSTNGGIQVLGGVSALGGANSASITESGTNSIQNVDAQNSLTVVGGSNSIGLATTASISDSGTSSTQDITVETGNLTVQAGAGTTAGNTAGILAAGPLQNIDVFAGNLVVSGGLTAASAGDTAIIATSNSSSLQDIEVRGITSSTNQGNIIITGGSGVGNFAIIESADIQGIGADNNGYVSNNITLQGGAAGTGNYAAITSVSNQTIDLNGNLDVYGAKTVSTGTNTVNNDYALIQTNANQTINVNGIMSVSAFQGRSNGTTGPLQTAGLGAAVVDTSNVTTATNLQLITVNGLDSSETGSTNAALNLEGGSLTVNNTGAEIEQSGTNSDQQINVTHGSIWLQGGTVNNGYALIDSKNTQEINNTTTVTGAGNLTLQGGGTTTNTGDFAAVTATSNQTINVAGAIGAYGSAVSTTTNNNDYALIYGATTTNSAQIITADNGITLSGLNGDSSVAHGDFAGIGAAIIANNSQTVTVTSNGGLTILGGTLAGSAAGIDDTALSTANTDATQTITVTGTTTNAAYGVILQGGTTNDTEALVYSGNSSTDATNTSQVIVATTGGIYLNGNGASSGTFGDVASLGAGIVANNSQTIVAEATTTNNSGLTMLGGYVPGSAAVIDDTAKYDTSATQTLVFNGTTTNDNTDGIYMEGGTGLGAEALIYSGNSTSDTTNTSQTIVTGNGGIYLSGNEASSTNFGDVNTLGAGIVATNSQTIVVSSNGGLTILGGTVAGSAAVIDDQALTDTSATQTVVVSGHSDFNTAYGIILQGGTTNDTEALVYSGNSTSDTTNTSQIIVAETGGIYLNGNGATTSQSYGDFTSLGAGIVANNSQTIAAEATTTNNSGLTMLGGYVADSAAVIDDTAKTDTSATQTLAIYGTTTNDNTDGIYMEGGTGLGSEAVINSSNSGSDTTNTSQIITAFNGGIYINGNQADTAAFGDVNSLGAGIVAANSQAITVSSNGGLTLLGGSVAGSAAVIDDQANTDTSAVQTIAVSGVSDVNPAYGIILRGGTASDGDEALIYSGNSSSGQSGVNTQSITSYTGGILINGNGAESNQVFGDVNNLGAGIVANNTQYITTVSTTNGGSGLAILGGYATGSAAVIDDTAKSDTSATQTLAIYGTTTNDPTDGIYLKGGTASDGDEALIYSGNTGSDTTNTSQVITAYTGGIYLNGNQADSQAQFGDVNNLGAGIVASNSQAITVSSNGGLTLLGGSVAGSAAVIDDQANTDTSAVQTIAFSGKSDVNPAYGIILQGGTASDGDEALIYSGNSSSGQSGVNTQSITSYTGGILINGNGAESNQVFGDVNNLGAGIVANNTQYITTVSTTNGGSGLALIGGYVNGSAAVIDDTAKSDTSATQTLAIYGTTTNDSTDAIYLYGGTGSGAEAVINSGNTGSDTTNTSQIITAYNGGIYLNGNQAYVSGFGNVNNLGAGIVAANSQAITVSSNGGLTLLGGSVGGSAAVIYEEAASDTSAVQTIAVSGVSDYNPAYGIILVGGTADNDDEAMIYSNNSSSSQANVYTQSVTSYTGGILINGNGADSIQTFGDIQGLGAGIVALNSQYISTVSTSNGGSGLSLIGGYNDHSSAVVDDQANIDTSATQTLAIYGTTSNDPTDGIYLKGGTANDAEALIYSGNSTSDTTNTGQIITAFNGGIYLNGNQASTGAFGDVDSLGAGIVATNSQAITVSSNGGLTLLGGSVAGSAAVIDDQANTDTSAVQTIAVSGLSDYTNNTTYGIVLVGGTAGDGDEALIYSGNTGSASAVTTQGITSSTGGIYLNGNGASSGEGATIMQDFGDIGSIGAGIVATNSQAITVTSNGGLTLLGGTVAGSAAAIDEINSADSNASQTLTISGTNDDGFGIELKGGTTNDAEALVYSANTQTVSNSGPGIMINGNQASTTKSFGDFTSVGAGFIANNTQDIESDSTSGAITLQGGSVAGSAAVIDDTTNAGNGTQTVVSDGMGSGTNTGYGIQIFGGTNGTNDEAIIFADDPQTVTANNAGILINANGANSTTTNTWVTSSEIYPLSGGPYFYQAGAGILAYNSQTINVSVHHTGDLTLVGATDMTDDAPGSAVIGMLDPGNGITQSVTVGNGNLTILAGNNFSNGVGAAAGIVSYGQGTGTNAYAQSISVPNGNITLTASQDADENYFRDAFIDLFANEPSYDQTGSYQFISAGQGSAGYISVQAGAGSGDYGYISSNGNQTIFAQGGTPTSGPFYSGSNTPLLGLGVTAAVSNTNSANPVFLNEALVHADGDQAITVESGNVEVIGGAPSTGGGGDNVAGIFTTGADAGTQTITIGSLSGTTNDTGNLIVNGGSTGVGGPPNPNYVDGDSNYFASAALVGSAGTQTITVNNTSAGNKGNITVTGGTGTGGAANIESLATQNIAANATVTNPATGSTITVQGGGPADGAYAAISSASNQQITADGNLFVLGSASTTNLNLNNDDYAAIATLASQTILVDGYMHVWAQSGSSYGSSNGLLSPGPLGEPGVPTGIGAAVIALNEQGGGVQSITVNGIDTSSNAISVEGGSTPVNQTGAVIVQYDPTSDQQIDAPNGGIQVSAGTAAQAYALIDSSNTQEIGYNQAIGGNLLVSGGGTATTNTANAGAFGAIVSTSNQAIDVAGNVSVLGTSAVNTSASNDNYAMIQSGDTQTMVVGGSLTVSANYGSSSGLPNNTFVAAPASLGAVITASNNQSIQVGYIMPNASLSVLGGKGTDNGAGIYMTNALGYQQIDVYTTSATAPYVGDSIDVIGGTGLNGFARISSSNTQNIGYNTDIVGNVLVQGGGTATTNTAATGAYAAITSSSNQTIEALGNISVLGTTAVNTSASNDDYALIQSGDTQNVFAGGSLTISANYGSSSGDAGQPLAQAGLGAAVIANDTQQVDVGFQSSTGFLSVLGGTGTNNGASLQMNGTLDGNNPAAQLINVDGASSAVGTTNDSVLVLGGTGANAFASILSNGQQKLGYNFGGTALAGNVVVQAGSGGTTGGAYATIQNGSGMNDFQYIFANGNYTIAGGTSSNDYASIVDLSSDNEIGQDIESYGTTGFTITAGSGMNSSAGINMEGTGGFQYITADGSIALQDGNGGNAYINSESTSYIDGGGNIYDQWVEAGQNISLTANHNNQAVISGSNVQNVITQNGELTLTGSAPSANSTTNLATIYAPYTTITIDSNGDSTNGAYSSLTGNAVIGANGTTSNVTFNNGTPGSTKDPIWVLSPQSGQVNVYANATPLVSSIQFNDGGAVGGTGTGTSTNIAGSAPLATETSLMEFGTSNDFNGHANSAVDKDVFVNEVTSTNGVAVALGGTLNDLDLEATATNAGDIINLTNPATALVASQAEFSTSNGSVDLTNSGNDIATFENFVAGQDAVQVRGTNDFFDYTGTQTNVNLSGRFDVAGDVNINVGGSPNTITTSNGLAPTDLSAIYSGTNETATGTNQFYNGRFVVAANTLLTAGPVETTTNGNTIVFTGPVVAPGTGSNSTAYGSLTIAAGNALFEKGVGVISATNFAPLYNLTLNTGASGTFYGDVTPTATTGTNDMTLEAPTMVLNHSFTSSNTSTNEGLVTVTNVNSANSTFLVDDGAVNPGGGVFQGGEIYIAPGVNLTFYVPTPSSLTALPITGSQALPTTMVYNAWTGNPATLLKPYALNSIFYKVPPPAINVPFPSLDTFNLLDVSQGLFYFYELGGDANNPGGGYENPNGYEAGGNGLGENGGGYGAGGNGPGENGAGGSGFGDDISTIAGAQQYPFMWLIFVDGYGSDYDNSTQVWIGSGAGYLTFGSSDELRAGSDAILFPPESYWPKKFKHKPIRWVPPQTGGSGPTR